MCIKDSNWWLCTFSTLDHYCTKQDNSHSTCYVLFCQSLLKKMGLKPETLVCSIYILKFYCTFNKSWNLSPSRTNFKVNFLKHSLKVGLFLILLKPMRVLLWSSMKAKLGWQSSWESLPQWQLCTKLHGIFQTRTAEFFRKVGDTVVISWLEKLRHKKVTWLAPTHRTIWENNQKQHSVLPDSYFNHLPTLFPNPFSFSSMAILSLCSCCTIFHIWKHFKVLHIVWDHFELH